MSTYVPPHLRNKENHVKFDNIPTTSYNNNDYDERPQKQYYGNNNKKYYNKPQKQHYRDNSSRYEQIISDLEFQLEQLNTELETIKKQNEILTSDLMKYKHGEQVPKSDFDKLKEESDKNRKNAYERNKLLNEQLTSEKERTNELQRAINKLNDDLVKQTAETKRFRDSIHDINEDRRALRKKVEELEANLEAYKSPQTAALTVETKELIPDDWHNILKLFEYVDGLEKKELSSFKKASGLEPASLKLTLSILRKMNIE